MAESRKHKHRGVVHEKQRKRYSAEIRAKVALEAIRGQKTANEIVAEYGGHPTRIARRKKK